MNGDTWRNADLTGRTARCAYFGGKAKYARTADGKCDSQQPSSWELAFFEFKGEGSKDALESCGKCGFHQVAHTKEGVAGNVRPTTVIEDGKCDGFVPKGPQEFDRFYCGCWGWD